MDEWIDAWKKKKVDLEKKYLVPNHARVGLGRFPWSWGIDHYASSSVQVLPLYV